MLRHVDLFASNSEMRITKVGYNLKINLDYFKQRRISINVSSCRLGQVDNLWPELTTAFSLCSQP